MFGAKMEPSWHQNGIKNRRAIFLKSCSGCSGGSMFQDLGVQVGSKNWTKSIKKWSPRWNASWHRFLNDFVGFWMPSPEAKSIKNRIEKTMQKTKPFGTRLGPSSGCQRGRDVHRPNATRPSATQRAENPLPGAARAAALRAKIQVKKETVLDVLTRLGPEARRFNY